MLRVAIESVLAQDFTDFEIVVSDNGSTDETATVVESFQDERIQYAPMGQNIGLHRNFTRCLGLGSAPYVAILQDDDFYLQGHLKSKVGLLDANPRLGLVHGRFHYVDVAGEPFLEDVDWRGREASTIEEGRTFVRRSLDQICRVNLSSAVLRRGCVRELQFSEEDGAQTDVGFWLRLGLRCDVGFVPVAGSVRRVHSGALSFDSGGLRATERSALVTIDLLESALGAQRRFMAEHRETLERDDPHLRRRHRSFAVRKTLDVLLMNRDEHGLASNLRLLLAGIKRYPELLVSPRTYRHLLSLPLGVTGRAHARRVKGQLVGRLKA